MELERRHRKCQRTRSVVLTASAIDLNEHVRRRRNGADKCHGNQRYGSRNEEGDFVTAHRLMLANTYYVKKDDHSITYNSSGR